MIAALLVETGRTVLLDIEGTTTSIDFVFNVLFPYARSHCGEFLTQHASRLDVRADLTALCDENMRDVRNGLNPPQLCADTPETERESLVTYIEWLIAHDRKSTPLKLLQGKIWEEGYRSGQLHGHVFEDVPRALNRWQEQKRNTCIFSSGSVLAQRLLFAHTTGGDLTSHISHFFDTTTGPKTDVQSYQIIARSLQLLPGEIVFISDVTAELDAAQSAGLQTLLCQRAGNRPQPMSAHRRIRSLDEVCPSTSEPNTHAVRSI
ncbi:MAG: acireductone synthase [Candidatus Sulfotelmatobacter sp.]